MSTWDYRVVARTNGDGAEYDIHEVYYDELGDITMWSSEPIASGGSTLAELAADLKLMAEAIERPVLNFETLKTRVAPDRVKGGTPTRLARSKHQQVADGVRQQIRTGLYPAGSVLPSTRALAREWDTSVYTVHVALQSLVSDGSIVCRNRSMRMVAPRLPAVNEPPMQGSE